MAGWRGLGRTKKRRLTHLEGPASSAPRVASLRHRRVHVGGRCDAQRAIDDAIARRLTGLRVVSRLQRWVVQPLAFVACCEGGG